MATNTKIAWTRSTFNPWIGCSKISPGCNSCYAEVSTPSRALGVKWGPGQPRHRTSASNWAKPLAWNKAAPTSEFAGRMGFWPVFCASLADVFDNEAPDEWRHELFDLIEQTPNLSWLLVTKRIGNVPKMAYRWLLKQEWPDNCRLLITVVNQEEADRDIPKLLALPCKNGISYEPALSAVDWRPFLAPQYVDAGGPRKRIEWCIVGGESSQPGHPARRFNIQWARDTIKQCKAAGTACFVKQLGSNIVTRNDIEWDDWPTCDPLAVEHDINGYREEYQGAPCRIRFLHDRAGADPDEWPDDLRIRQFPNEY